MSTDLRAVLDTCVWVDSFCADHKGHKEARDLLTHAYKKRMQLLFAIHSAPDVLYILTQEFKRASAQEKGELTESSAVAAKATALGCLRNMENLATAIGADVSDLWMADKYLRVHNDLEDNLVLAACHRSGADFLVTTDERLLRHADVAAKTPAEMLAILEAH